MCYQQWFNISRFCHQGCPISPILFESLGNRIRNNDNIKGIIVNGNEEKGAQYVDDLWLFLLADEQSLECTMAELKNFEQFSGLKINKTRIIRMGYWPDMTHK